MSHKINNLYEFGPFRLDATERQLLRAGESVSLTPKAFDLLLALVERHGRLVEKDELLKLVWPDAFVEEANLTYNISFIRKALSDGENGLKFVETVAKRGYRFVAEVREARPVSVEDERPNEQTALLAESTSESKAPEGKMRLAWIAAAVAALIALSALSFAIAHLRRPPPAEVVTLRFTITAPEKVTRLLSPKLSPDGRNLVFGAVTDGKPGLWLRPLGSLTAQLLLSTEAVNGSCFWSPDSRSLCFFAASKLKKFDLAGGATQTLCSLPGGGEGANGGTWNRDGIILFNSGGRIYRVPASGGEPVLVVVGRDQPDLYRWPVFLPDGRHFLYFGTSPQAGASEVYLASLDGKETTRLLSADSQAIYAASALSTTGSATGSGHLLFAREGALLAQPFDASRLKLTGEPLVVADKVAVSTGRRGSFSVSDNGSLVYDSTGGFDDLQLTWVDRKGKTLESVGEPGVIEAPKLSPDGKRVAVVRLDPKTRNRDIYVTDLAQGASLRLTFDPGGDGSPIWSPDGSRIAWAANRGTEFHLYQKLASGVGPEELLLKTDAPIGTGNWSSDGRFIVYAVLRPQTGHDLWVLPIESERRPVLFLQTPFSEQHGRFSPDGRWIAYVSNDQGREEVYVQPFPASGGKWQVSTTGGTAPHWRSDGKEIFYLSAGKLMAVEVKPGSSFEAGTPKTLFDFAPLRGLTPYGNYAATADGQRFLLVTQRQALASLQYTVVTNLAAEAKK